MTSTRRRSNSRRGRNKVMAPAAVEVAREAIADIDESPAGPHLGVNVMGKGVGVHRFAADLPGYRGWEWNVVVACAPGADRVTVSEVALVPGKKALQAPEWVPYEERLQPGDLGPRDIMPAGNDDERLTGDPVAERRLSEIGEKQTHYRWLEGETGPDGDFAKEALKHCSSCAFFIPLSGSLGRDWGACVNEWAFDGSVVFAGHGCGAHSAIPEVTGQGVPVQQPFDDQEIVETTEL